jgi:acyl carrier protein
VARELATVLGAARGGLARGSEDLFSDGFLDSFGMVELSSRLEVAFGIALPMEELTAENFCSVPALAQMLVRLGAV